MPGTLPPGTLPPGTMPPGTLPPEAMNPDAIEPEPLVPEPIMPEDSGDAELVQQVADRFEPLPEMALRLDMSRPLPDVRSDAARLLALVWQA